MAGIRIAFVSDVSQTLRASGDVAEALDKDADALDDVAKRGDAASADLERSFREMARAANKSAGEVGDSFKDGYRTAERAAKDFGDTADRATDEAGDATGEFKDEARSNFSEVASSFSGDMTSAADLVQGTLGGLAGSLAGPAGLAAGALAIIGGTLFQSFNANAEKVEQRAGEMYDDLLASGADFLSKEYIADQLGKIYRGAEDAAIQIQRLRALATDADIPEPLLARALVGDEAAQAEVRERITAQRLAINEALDEATAKGQNLAPTYAPAIQALQDIEHEMSDVAGATETARANAANAAAAVAGIDASRAAASAEDARSKFDGLGRKLDDLANKEVKVPVTADTTALDRELAKPRTVTVIPTPALGQRVV